MTKSPQAYRTISEVSDSLQVPQHVLRFWETKFSFLRPMKRAGGRRLYRPQDVVLLRGVQTLLYRDGYTIKGVQKLYKEQGVKRFLEAAGSDADHYAALGSDDGDTAIPHTVQPSVSQNSLEYILNRLIVTKSQLDSVLGR